MAQVLAKLSLFVAVLATGQVAPAPQRIVIAGDSTAANYPASRYPQTGWGMMLGCALDEVSVDNLAIGGRSTKSFIDEGRLDKLLAGLKPGDTVLIQFGHNDATREKPERFVEARGAYRDNLLRFIWSIRGAGGVPVLVTPVARRSFDAAGKAKADFAEYSAVVRELATTTKTPLIDLESLSRALVDRTGVEKSRALFLHYTPADKIAAFPEGIKDDTHFSELGARQVADLVAGGLAGLGLPVSAQVRAKRPELTRTKPLGSTSCR